MPPPRGANTQLAPDTEAQLAEFAGRFYADPYGFVMAAYPWGEKTLADGGYNRLANKDGPEKWQKEYLIDLGKHIRRNLANKKVGLFPNIWRSATASGHDVGKSALVCWLIQFFMATRRDTRGLVTAGTQRQLEDKTWPELAIWHSLFLFQRWFTWTATSYYFKLYAEERRKNYMFTAMTVSKDNSEAFQGLHNSDGSVVILFDEASGVEQPIWTASEGALFDGEGFFAAFGNPTRPDGAFADCFDKHASLYRIRNIDTREARLANPQAIYDLIAKYDGNEDHDDIRVRVRGLFPRQSYNGFISIDIVDDAIARELVFDDDAALIMGVDVARYGNDTTVLKFRQGRDARTRDDLVFRGLSTTGVARHAMEAASAFQPDAIVIEATGGGAGVIDIMRDHGYRVIEVHPGAKSGKPQLYANVRAEMWGDMRNWLAETGCIRQDADLYAALTKIQYSLERHQQSYLMESKEEYKRRTGLPSPDKADALALTFAAKVKRRDVNLQHRAHKKQAVALHIYDPLTYA